MRYCVFLGRALQTVTPATNSITAAMVGNDLISGKDALTSAPADTDEFLVSDAGTLKRIDYSLVKSDPTHVLLSTTTISSSTTNVDITSNIDSTYNNYRIEILNLHPSADHELRVRFFTGTGGSQAVDTGNNYQSSHLGMRVARTSELTESEAGASYFGMPEGQYIDSGVAAACYNATMFLRNPADTTFHFQVNTFYSGEFITSNYLTHGNTACRYLQTTAVTGIRFFMGSGDIDNAIIKLYGIK